MTLWIFIIFNITSNFNAVKDLITLFIQNKGNINLQSYTRNITALSEAIRLKNKDLIKYLLENGADINTLTEEQTQDMENILKVPGKAN